MRGTAGLVSPAMLARRPIAGLVLAASLLIAPAALAGKVKGTVEGFHFLLNPSWAEAKDPERHRFSFREPVPTVPAKFRKLFPHIPKELCIAALGATKQTRKPILIRVGGGRTTPVTIVVPPGTTLQFQNTDPFKHRLYGVGVSAFSPSDTGKGATREWTVPGPGSFEIRDELAPSLSMFVIGEPNVAQIAYPSIRGEFLLDLSEEGEYTIQAYFAGKKVGDPETVTVGAGDMTLKKPLVVGKAPKKEDASKASKDDD